MVGEEIWRYQDGTGKGDFIFGAATLSDGSFVLAGITWGSWEGASNAGDRDLVAVKISSYGTLLWTWQEGSSGVDYFFTIEALEDDSVVIAGFVNGTWNGEASLGGYDFAAVKLDSDGTTLWSWREGTGGDDEITTAEVTTDGNIVLAGYTRGNWAGSYVGGADAAAVKLDANGTVLWRWQEGADGDSVYIYASTARPDGSVVLAGFTYESWDGALSPEAITDFMAVALDEDGAELWRWQDGSDGNNLITTATTLTDGSVVLAGYTEGDWGGNNQGGRDFAAMKLDFFGVEEWRWQDGTIEDDRWNTAAFGTDGSIILAGYTEGSWEETNVGDRDFAALSMDTDGEVLWTYQAGTPMEDYLNVATIREDDTVLLAGWTAGSWDISNSDYFFDFAAVLLDTGVTANTPPPTPPEPATTPSSPVPSLAPSRIPVVSSGSDAGRNAIIIGVVVGVSTSLAVIGVCIFRRQKAKGKVDSPARAEEGLARSPHAVTPPPGPPPPPPYPKPPSYNAVTQRG